MRRSVPDGTRLKARVAIARRGLRRAGAASVGLAAVVLLLALTALAVLLAPSPVWRSPGAGPLILDLAAVAGVAVLVWLLGRRWVRALDDTAVAADAERARGMHEGAVRGALELSDVLPPGASADLAGLAERDALGRLGTADVELAPSLGRVARRRLAALGGTAAALVLVLATAGFVAPTASRAGVASLLNPVAHLRGPTLPPLRLTTARRVVPRGARTTVEVSAPLREAVALEWRPRQGLAGRRQLTLSAGAARALVGPIDAPTQVWVRAPDGALSDTLLVVPDEPLLLTGLEVEATYPAYLNRPPEQFRQPVPPLSLPWGTRLVVRGQATAPLVAARLESAHERTSGEPAAAGAAGSGEAVPLAVEGDRFVGSWTPAASGRYAIRLDDGGGRDLAGSVEPLDVTLVPDSAPVVRVSYPGTDTVVPADMRLPVVAQARDDHGLSDAALIGWRVSGYAGADEPIGTAIPLSVGEPQALLRLVLRLDDFRLLPGDTLKYYVRARDGSPARREGRSRTYTLVFPSMAELRSSVRADSRELVDEAERMTRRAEELARRARDEARSMSWPGQGRGQERAQGGSTSMESAERARLEDLLKQDEALVDEVESMRDRLDALERAMEAAGLNDPRLQQQMRELRELYEDALSDDLRRRLQELERGLDTLDPEQVRQALEQLAQEQEALRERLERSLELFRRAAAEQEMSALAQESRELAGRQEAVAGALEEPESAGAGQAEQQALEGEADRLGAQIDSLAARLAELGEQATAQAAERAGGDMDAARQDMARARQQSAAGESQSAGEQGRSAAQRMAGAAEQLEGARQAMAQGWKQEATDAVQQATQDVLSLAQEQETLRRRMEEQASSRPGPSTSDGRKGMQGEQAGLEQSLESLGRNLSEAGQRSALVDRDVGAALGRSMIRMSETREALADERAALPVEQAQQAVEALNKLALELVENADRIERSESGTGLQEALEQLAQLAQQQGALNNRSGALMPLALSGPAMANQLRELASEQRGVAQGLEEVERKLDGSGDVLGRMDELAAEAEALARQMEAGALPPEARARQERLFHRLLDAGRSLERDETSEDRRAERPESAEVDRARALDPSLMRGPRYRPPSDEQLRRLSPAYRKLILDYFDRLNRDDAGAARAGGAE